MSDFSSTLQPDAPLVQSAAYKFTPADRQYIDGQAIACETFLSTCLLNEVVATYGTVAGTSASLSPGDVICLAGTVAGTVTLATAAALASAGAPLGVVLEAASPGGRVRYALAGHLPVSVTGLTAAAGAVRVSSLGRPEQVASLDVGDYGIGTTDGAGWLRLGLGSGDGGLYQATTVPTADKVVKWGAGVELGASYFWENGYAGALASAGLIRIGNGPTYVLEGHAAAGTATRWMLAWDAAEFKVGGTSDSVDVNAQASVALGASGSKAFFLNDKGIQLFGGGVPSFGGGERVVGLTFATTAPTTAPSGGIVAYADATGTKVWSPKKIRTTIAPEANSAPTWCVLDRVLGFGQTTDASSVAAWVWGGGEFPANSAGSLELMITGIQVGATNKRAHFKVLCGVGRDGVGAGTVDSTDVQTLDDNIGVGGPPSIDFTGAEEPRVSVPGKAATTINWTVTGMFNAWTP